MILCTVYSLWKLINLSGNCLQRFREFAKQELILVGHCLVDVQLLFASLICTTVEALVIDTLDKTLYELSIQKNPFQQPGPVNCMDNFSAS